MSTGFVIHVGGGHPLPGAGGSVVAAAAQTGRLKPARTISFTCHVVFRNAWQVTSDTPGSTLILTVPGGIEDFFDDLAAGTSMEELTHRHGVRFLS